MKKKFALILCSFFVGYNLFGLMPHSLFGAMTLDITRAQVAPTPIALAPLYHENFQLAELGSKIMDVVAGDLERSGLFKPIDPRAFVQDAVSLNQAPRFGDWRLINAQILAKGNLKMLPGGKIRAEFRLFDVVSEKQMEAVAFFGETDSWRRIAHKIADAIYKRITGEEGYFDTQIAYIAESGSPTKKIKRLAIMDQDGANHRYLTNGRTLVLTPRFSPNMQQLTYLDFASGKARVYVMDLMRSTRQILGNYTGMTIAPRFSPDGRQIVMSVSKDGNTNLLSMDFFNKSEVRLTSNTAINTSPCYSPDGTKICFNSDKSGKTQIYVMPAAGGEAQRISFEGGSYRTPVWSPRGDLIAFTKITDGDFYIGVMKPDGSGERLLSRGWVVEDPAWAPNGRVIMFTRRDSKGSSRICTIDLTGHNERIVPTISNASAGTWSPLIP